MEIQAGNARAECVHCAHEMEPSHMLGGLRYYVCRPCNAWSIPYPPDPRPSSPQRGSRCVSSRVGVPYVGEAT
jgi:hypothetical protein